MAPSSPGERPRHPVLEHCHDSLICIPYPAWVMQVARPAMSVQTGANQTAYCLNMQGSDKGPAAGVVRAV